MTQVTQEKASREPSAPMAGKVVLVTGDLVHVGATLASNLADLGAVVSTLGLEPAVAQSDQVNHFRDSVATRGEALERFSAVSAAIGDLDAVVHVAGVEPSIVDRTLMDTDDEAWDQGAEAPIRAALATIQGAFVSFGDRGGSIVTLVPSIAMTGGPGITPFACAAEGIRLLTKSAARQYGPHGIRANAIAVPISLWEVEQADEHVLISKFGPSLPGADLAKDIAGAVSFLAGDLSSGVNGTTMVVDSGSLMVP